MPKDSPVIDVSEPTARNIAFADWLEEQSGYEVDVTSVQLAVEFNTAFRGSDADQAWRAAAKESKEATRLDKRVTAAGAVFDKRAAAVQSKIDALESGFADLETKRERIMANAKVEVLTAKLEDIEEEREAKLAAIRSGEPLRRSKKTAEPATPAKRAPRKAAAKTEPVEDEVATRRAAKKAPARKTAAKKAPAKRRSASPVVPSDDDF